MKPRILFLYSFINNNGSKQYFNLGLYNAFAKSHEIFYGFPYADLMVRHGKQEMNNRVLAFAKACKPDIVFLQYIDAGDIFVQTVKELSKTSKVVIWSGDMYQPTLMKWVFDYAPHVISCFSNTDYIKELHSSGYQAQFLNHYCEELYYPIPGLKKEIDIVFIGSHFTRYPLSQERYNIVKYLHDNYTGFRVYGDNWPTDFNARFISREESNSVYNKANIAVNYSNLESPLYTSDRLMHILGSGTFCLCKYFPQAEKLFTDGIHLRFFNTFEELKQLADYYLIHEEERNKIAEAGRIKCIELFGDTALINKIIKIHNENL